MLLSPRGAASSSRVKCLGWSRTPATHPNQENFPHHGSCFSWPLISLQRNLRSTRGITGLSLLYFCLSRKSAMWLKSSTVYWFLPGLSRGLFEIASWWLAIGPGSRISLWRRCLWFCRDCRPSLWVLTPMNHTGVPVTYPLDAPSPPVGQWNRLRYVSLKTSKSCQLDYGVPQDSGLGLQLFTVNTMPLSRILRDHGLEYHFFTEDSQLFMFMEPVQAQVDGCVGRLGLCCTDIRAWMARNFLKLRGDKTGVLLIGSNLQLKEISISGVKVGHAMIAPSATREPSLTPAWPWSLTSVLCIGQPAITLGT